MIKEGKIYIYEWYFFESGKYYIGQSDNVVNRIKTELRVAYDEKSRGYNFALSRAIRKHGKNYCVRIIDVVPDRKAADELEKWYIASRNSFGKCGYNLTSGGTNNKQVSRETRKKMSIAASGERNAMFGKNHSEESRRQMSVASSGENNGMFGKKHTEETKKTMALAKQKLVVRLGLDGSFIKLYASLRAASEEGFNLGHISSVCVGRLKKHKGYKWEHYSMEKYGTYEVYKNTKTGELLRIPHGQEGIEKRADANDWVKLDHDPEVQQDEHL